MSTHQFIIEKILLEFQELIQMYDAIQLHKTQIHEKLQYLNTVYQDLIKTNNKKNVLFCLDTFYFQYKVLLIEMDNISRYISLINNRIYGDHYKLNNIIISQLNAEQIQFITANHSLDSSNNSLDSSKYTIYKDLEPFREYPIIDIKSIHTNITYIINQIHLIYSNKMSDIQSYNKNKIGLSIENFINTLEYENNLNQEQIHLYINYISFFHKMHSEYMNNLLNKIADFHNQIDETVLSNNSDNESNKKSGNALDEYTIFTIQDF